jgi:transcriptional regulator with XRE-family HTH domain
VANSADETFGQRIARLREERGWSRQELARRAHVSTRQIYLVEGEKIHAVRPDTLARYAAVFNVSRQYLQVGIDIRPSLPDLATYLHLTTELPDDAIDSVVRIVDQLQADTAGDREALTSSLSG